MTVYAETERLRLRAIDAGDAPSLLELDTYPEVYRYLGGQAVFVLADAEKIVAHIQRQYKENGIGRWAVIRKSDNAFLGWCGIKLVNDRVTGGRIGYFDIGYRLMPRYWRQGYAREAAFACRDYAFSIMKVEQLYATIMEGNTASQQIALRLGMQHDGQYLEEGALWHWYVLERPAGPEHINP